MPPPAPEWSADDQPAPGRPAPGKRRWYGSQTLASDAIATGMLLTAASSESGGLATLSLVTYLLVPPVIHGAHGQAGMSFASFGIRLSFPLLGMTVGSASADCGGEDKEMFCGLSEAMLGFGVGALSAMVIDGAFLAWESPPERIRISPTVTATRRGATAGVLGTF